MEIETQKLISVGLMSIGAGLVLLSGVSGTACTQVRTRDVLTRDISIGDDIEEQDSRAVHVQIRCDGPIGFAGKPTETDYLYGSSGVAIGGNRVMTAAHSIPCRGDIWVTTQRGVTLWATIKARMPGNDSALLEVDGLSASPVRLGPAPKGSDVICAVTAHPVRGRICGTVAYIKASGPGAIISSLEAVPGNSGSGVYDMDGGLVGLVITGCKVPGCGKTGASAIGSK